MREATLEQKVVAWVEAQGGIAEKVEAKGKRGWPDLAIYLPGGRHALVELKRPGGGKVSAHQRRYRSELLKLGHLAFVADSLQDIQRKIEEWYGAAPARIPEDGA